MKSKLVTATAFLLVAATVGQAHAGQSRTAGGRPVHGPRPEDDPCVEAGTCGQGDHGNGKAAINGQPNCNAWWGEPDPDCTAELHSGHSGEGEVEEAVTCRIVAVGETPELSNVDTEDAEAFEAALIAEAHHRLIVDVQPGTYWLLFWNSATGHRSQKHQVTCTEDGGEYHFVESPFPVY